MTQKELKTGQLPEHYGKTYIARIVSMYSVLFRNKYEVVPRISFARYGKQIKELIEHYTEYQISALLISFFNWAGTSDDDEFARKRLINATHPFGWFLFNITPYEVYLRNVYGLNFDNEEEVKKFVEDNLSTK